MVQNIEKLIVILNRLGTVKGRTRLQKIIFLLNNKEGIPLDYHFIPYYYGPYSRDLQLEIDFLEAAGFVEVRPQDGILYVHKLTEKGKEAAKKIEEEIGKTEMDKLLRVLEKYKRRTTSSLIKEAKELAGMHY